MQKVEFGPRSKKKVPALAQLFQPPTNCNPVTLQCFIQSVSVTTAFVQRTQNESYLHIEILVHQSSRRILLFLPGINVAQISS